MSFEALEERIAALHETTGQIQALIQRLATIKFQPGSIPLAGSEGDVSTELGGEIQKSIREQSEDLELLEQEVQDLPAGRDEALLSRKGVLEGQVKRAYGDIKVSTSNFRQAQLIARASLDAAQRTERSLLLQSYIAPSTTASPLSTLFPPKPKAGPLTKEDKELAAASDATLALRRLHNGLSSELSRSQYAHDTLNESTAALKDLGETYSSLDSVLAKSKSLLGTLMTSQKSDTWYLETALYVLVATIVWLVWRRLLYGPTWWLVWFPIKLFWGFWMWTFTMVGLRGGSTVAVSAHVSSVSSSIVPSVTVASSVSIATPETNSAARNEPEGLIEEVGRIIDGSGPEEEVDVVEDSTRGNPKKRMWEEEKETQHDREGETGEQIRTVRDEL